MSGLLRRARHLLCRHAERRGPDLPADLHRHLHESRLCEALHREDTGHRGRPAERSRAAVFEQHEIPLKRVLTDRGTEYCGQADRHPYELYLALEDIDHSRTKAKSPQTNGICERFNKTLLNEFYRVVFRKHLYRTLEAMQADLDAFLAAYN